MYVVYCVGINILKMPFIFLGLIIVKQGNFNKKVEMNFLTYWKCGSVTNFSNWATVGFVII